MPHPDNPAICKGKMYGPGTWQAQWFRDRYDRLAAKMETEKRERPMTDPALSLLIVGGETRRYLTDEEAGAFYEAGNQVQYVERELARQRRDARRAAARSQPGNGSL